MTTHIALLRGVNVSGANRLPMAAFRKMLGGLGLKNVRTYIASGNAVFNSALGADVLMPLLREAIQKDFGFAIKLADRLPRFLPTPMTARNLRTVGAICAMTDA